MKRFNQAGLLPQYIPGAPTPEKVAAEAFYNVYTGPDLPRADVDHLVAQALVWWGKAGIPTEAEITPFVESAIACFKIHAPLLPGAGPDGKGGCVFTAQVAPAPQPAPTAEDACKALNGTWDQATGCALPDNGDCAKQGGIWNGKVCSKPAQQENVSRSSGLLIGGLIAAVTIGIVAMTLNQNPKKKGTSR